jgi:chromosome segregation ATPase
MRLLRRNTGHQLVRKAAKADAKVAALTEESTQLQLRRSQAQTTLAQFEANRLRADLEALHARYTELERSRDVPLPGQAQRRSS